MPAKETLVNTSPARRARHPGGWSWLVLTVTAYALWFSWSGHTEPLLLGLGLASSLVVALLSRSLDIVDRESTPFDLTARTIPYVIWLGWQVVLSNLEVIRRVLRPRPDDRASILRVPTSQQSDLGKVTYANSITLTPGTVTLALSGSTLTVHALTPAAAAGLRDGEMDRRVSVVEGLG